MDLSWLWTPVRRLHGSPDAAPEPWRRAAASLRWVGWVLAGMVGVALAVWVVILVLVMSIFVWSPADFLALVAYAAGGLVLAAGLFVSLAWLPASLYDRLLRGDPMVRWRARAVGLALVPLGLVGLPLAWLAATAGMASGGWFIAAFLTAGLFGLGGPWLVVAGLRLVRLRTL